MNKIVNPATGKHEDLEYFKWMYRNQYILRMQCENFLIVIDKYTKEYRNIYSLDTKKSREFLKEIAEIMDKHKSLL